MRQTWVFAYMPYENATARQRAFLVAEQLAAQTERHVVVKSPLSSRSYRRYASPRGLFDRLAWGIEMCCRRAVQTWRFRSGDIAVVQREMMPVGPPVLERWLRRKASALLLDIDDAVYASAADRTHSRIGRALMTKGKFEALVAMSDGVVCGSPALQTHVAALGARTWLIPTSLEFPELEQDLVPNTQLEAQELTVGWLGNPGNLWTLRIISGAILRLIEEGHRIHPRVMSSRPPTPDESGGAEWAFHAWSVEEEPNFLSGIDVGVMPLPDDEYSRAKCGFKALRYISAGVPVIVSPVGVNADIVRDGVTGFWAATSDSWYSALSRFMDLSQDERAGLARAARASALKSYSLDCAVRSWIEVLEAVD